MAMRTDLALVVRRVEGVLLRVLGTVVRRGFEPVSVASQLGRQPNTFEIALTVEGDRSVETLSRHLANLYDVEHVEVRR